MKKLVFVGMLIGSFAGAAAAGESFSYRCECIDTGIECEGGEMMFVDVDEESASYVIADRDGVPYVKRGIRATIDRTYRSEEYADYSKYEIAGSRSFPHLLVETAMASGESSGTVFQPEVINGEFAHTWIFECDRIEGSRVP